MMKFDLPTDQSSIIKVIGVGGGGSNAVNHMYRQGINGVDFIVCNTDKQALDISPVPYKIALGTTLTEGRGAGSMPEVGKNAAIENIEELRSILGNSTKMVFITAGMGGGTGTGAAPVIASVAKDMGILTVGIVTVPFGFEGKKRRQQAEQGVEELKKHVDTLLIISNDKLREIYGNLKLTEAFGHADDILTTAAKGIADIITTTLHINTDFADIQTVMKDSGVAIMGSSWATGENRAIKAVEQALSSPLLNDSNISGARYVLLNITCGSEEITMDELGEITDYIQEAAGQTAELIKGYGIDDSLGDKVSVTIIATGFTSKADLGYQAANKQKEVVRHVLTNDVAPVVTPIAEQIVEPVAAIVTPVVSPLVEEPQLKIEAAQTPSEIINEVKNDVVSNIQEEPYLKSSVEVSNSVELEITSSIVEPQTNSYVSSTEMTSSIVNTLDNEVKNDSTNEEITLKTFSAEEQQKKANERIAKLKQISFKIKTPQGLSDMESEPAYVRRNVNLSSVPHSSESNISRYTLTDGDDNKAEIKPNNSFLHDNVD